MTSRAYCAVDGCMNQKTMKEVSFFKLPMDAKRRNEWLRTIGRPDLQEKADLKPDCHFVCSIHFDETMVIAKPILRPYAVPTKHIPNSTDVEKPKVLTAYANKHTQTKDFMFRDNNKDKEAEVRQLNKKKRLDATDKGASVKMAILNNPEIQVKLIKVGAQAPAPAPSRRRALRARLRASEAARARLEAELRRLTAQLDDNTCVVIKEEVVEE